MAHFTNTDQATFQNLLQNDPEIQKVIQGVWGDTPVNQRPSNTPKNLEAANDAASKQISQILAQRGVKLPPHSFINPRTASLEGQHGWAGLPTAVKVAIIAGVAATGIGAAAMLGPAGGALAGTSGATSAASSAGAAAIPSIGVTSGLAGALPGIATGVGGAAGIGAAGATGAGLLASTPLLSAAPMIGSAAATGGSLAGGAGLAGAGGVASTMGNMLKTAAPATGGSSGIMKTLLNPAVLGAVGSGIGALGQTAASNRGTQLDAQMAADKMKLDAGADRRTDENQIMKNMQIAEYLKNGGAKIPSGPQLSANGKPITQYNFGPKASTDAEKTMAGTMEKQMMDRLNTVPQLSDYSKLMTPGTGESAMNWLGTIISGAGAVQKARQPAPVLPAAATTANPVAPPVRPSAIPGITTSSGLPFNPGVRQ